MTIPSPSDTARGMIFLTGAAGHTGAHAVRRLLASGWRVRALVRTPGHESRLPSAPNLEIIRGDLLDSSPAWTGSMTGAQAVLHIANIRFAPQIIAACSKAGVRRIVAMSSTRRFTRFPDEVAERVRRGEAAFEASDLDWTILRPSMIYGDERDNNMEKLVRWLRRTPFVPLIAGGRNLIQPVFVGDLVDAMIRVLEAPSETVTRRVLTVAGPRPLPLREALATIASGLGRRPVWIPVPYAAVYAAAAFIEALPGRALFRRDQVRRLLEDKAFDISETCAALPGWRPRLFAEGIEVKLNNSWTD